MCLKSLFRIHILSYLKSLGKGASISWGKKDGIMVCGNASDVMDQIVRELDPYLSILKSSQNPHDYYTKYRPGSRMECNIIRTTSHFFSLVEYTIRIAHYSPRIIFLHMRLAESAEVIPQRSTDLPTSGGINNREVKGPLRVLWGKEGNAFPTPWGKEIGNESALGLFGIMSVFNKMFISVSKTSFV